MRPTTLLLCLLPLAIGVVTTLAWERAGRDRYAALEREGVVLAGVVRGAALEAAETLALAERGLSERLASVARRADVEVARTRAPAAEILARVAAEERVGWIFLFDAEQAPVASAQWPAPAPGTVAPRLLAPGRKEAILWRDARAALGAEAVAAGGVRVEGLVANAFGTRERFGVLYGRPGGGVLLVRAPMDELTDLRRQFGLGPLLQRIIQLPAVETIRVAGADGGPDVIALGTEATEAGAARAGLLRERAAVTLPNGERYTVEVGLSRAPADVTVASSRRWIVIGALLALAISLGAAWLLLAREASARRQQAESAARLEEEKRLAEMGALAGLVTHEVNNPLNALRLGLAVLDGAGSESVRRSVVATMNAEVDRMARTLEGYMALARNDRRPRRPIGPEMLTRVQAQTKEEARRAGVTVLVHVASNAPTVAADPVVLQQALANVVRNALQASAQGGTVRLGWTCAAEGGAEITVRDGGPGFPPDRAALLRLGGTRRETGHGLGLPLAKRFIETHGGRLALGDAPDGGGEVTIHLPPAGDGGATDA